ncbi:HzsA-related protein [Novipirellula artificiosorum]|uniref:Cytochrome c domain-containing protein n=1 Tax=Novipirellula artificiosorum TaxID=2528016 RepID=A0A5C6DIS6_9BACT|nr:hypothetical protein [Novipirellula artificiosorum]TWU35994.1 hypothetical protein Poly41_37460 [Novipirellula artificiosorum]
MKRMPVDRLLLRPFTRWTRAGAAAFVVLGWLPFCLAVDDPAPRNPLRPRQPLPAEISIGHPIVFTLLPIGVGLDAPSETPQPIPGDAGKIVLRNPEGQLQILTADFESACDPSVSADGQRLLFAGRVRDKDPWNIFELTLATQAVRQITHRASDCRSPCYQSTLFTLDSPEPWYQITFLSSEPEECNDDGSSPAAHLYSCKLDGTTIRRLTFNLSSDLDPWLMSDGRLLHASWQRARLDHGNSGYMGLFAVNIDGIDFSRYGQQAGKRFKRMPCVGDHGLVLFVESDDRRRDGSGCLGSVTERRPLHSYQSLTTPADGRYHSPSPLPGGKFLVSHRAAGDSTSSYGIYRYDPNQGRRERLVDDPAVHEVQARVIRPSQRADGRSTVVDDLDPIGGLYCLNVGINDLEHPELLFPQSAKRLRVLEGVPPQQDKNDPDANVVQLARRRILGETDLAKDGSFKVEIPANTAIELQLLGQDGMALRSCGWIWSKNHESRGCIGCHEDGELTPENGLVDGVAAAAVSMTAPAKDRPAIRFRLDIAPLLQTSCTPCHSDQGALPRLSVDDIQDDASLRSLYQTLLKRDPATDHFQYIQPGKARTSPLVWHLLGRNTSQPWDAATQDAIVKPMNPPDSASQINRKSLTDQEVQQIILWIDLGACWDHPDP